MKRSAKDFEQRLQTRINVKDATKKVRALILYIAREMADDPHFGMVKLNKTLWWIDFLAFQARGVPVTGMRYQKLDNGPVLRMMPPMLIEMEKIGLIARRDEKMTEEHTRKLVIPRQSADMTIFTPEERTLIDYSIKKLKGVTAKSASRESHGPAWEMTELKCDIPYELALISERPPSRQAFQHAKKLAVQLKKQA